MTESTLATNELAIPAPWWPSEVCSEQFFRRVVGATETAYLANAKGRLPDVTQIKTYMGRNPDLKKIASVLQTPEFRAAVGQRGINWSSKTAGITPEQSYALAIMTDPSLNRISFANRLKRAGVTYQRWRIWMKEPLFSTAFENQTENNLKDSVGIAHTALIGKAAEGDMRAIEYLHQITGRFDPQREANMNMQAIMAALIEVLAQRITDSSLLIQIGDDLEKILSANGATNNRQAIDNIIDAEIHEESGDPVVSAFSRPL